MAPLFPQLFRHHYSKYSKGGGKVLKIKPSSQSNLTKIVKCGRIKVWLNLLHPDNSTYVGFGPKKELEQLKIFIPFRL